MEVLRAKSEEAMQVSIAKQVLNVTPKREHWSCRLDTTRTRSVRDYTLSVAWRVESVAQR